MTGPMLALGFYLSVGTVSAVFFYRFFAGVAWMAPRGFIAAVAALGGLLWWLVLPALAVAWVRERVWHA